MKTKSVLVRNGAAANGTINTCNGDCYTQIISEYPTQPLAWTDKVLYGGRTYINNLSGVSNKHPKEVTFYFTTWIVGD